MEGVGVGGGPTTDRQPTNYGYLITRVVKKTTAQTQESRCLIKPGLLPILKLIRQQKMAFGLPEWVNVASGFLLVLVFVEFGFPSQNLLGCWFSMIFQFARYHLPFQGFYIEMLSA